MKSLVSIAAALVVFVGACTTNGAESDAVFTPRPGLECPTDESWGEFGYIADDAVGLATPAAAIEVGMARWTDREEGELTFVDSPDEEDAPLIGALVVGGNRVVLTFPEPAPAGGWLTPTTVGCEGYEP
jgi:hypothetical protein